MKLGSTEVNTLTTTTQQLTMLIWGKPASGKTVLASTAPGRKLWLQFDPNGTASLRKNDDILVADFANFKAVQLASFKQGGIIEQDLIKAIKDENISTVVVDSLTSFGQLALTYAIASGTSNRGTFRASIEQPGQTGYGVRSAMVLDFCTMILRVCADAKCHCVFIAHDQDVMDDDGRLIENTISLGGQSKNIIPAKINEIWYLEDNGKERSIYVRAHGVKRPMRTRMFLISEGDPVRFTFRYDQTTQKGEGISDWYKQWEQTGDKIRIPK